MRVRSGDLGSYSIVPRSPVKLPRTVATIMCFTPKVTLE